MESKVQVIDYDSTTLAWVALILSVISQLPTLIYVFFYLHGEETIDKWLTGGFFWSCWFPVLFLIGWAWISIAIGLERLLGTLAKIRTLGKNDGNRLDGLPKEDQKP